MSNAVVEFVWAVWGAVGPCLWLLWVSFLLCLRALRVVVAAAFLAVAKLVHPVRVPMPRVWISKGTVSLSLSAVLYSVANLAAVAIMLAGFFAHTTAWSNMPPLDYLVGREREYTDPGHGFDRLNAADLMLDVLLACLLGFSCVAFIAKYSRGLRLV